MTEPTSSNSDPPLEASIPEGAVSVESILCTEELSRRPSRPPDYKQENRALQALASTLADAPSTILQTLAETILWATDSDSSGLSLLAPDGKVRARFDCNRGGGAFKISLGKLSFGPLMSTRMACPEDSLDAPFMRDLQRVTSFFTQDGLLYLELPYDSGTMKFCPEG